MIVYTTGIWTSYFLLPNALYIYMIIYRIELFYRDYLQ